MTSREPMLAASLMERFRVPDSLVGDLVEARQGGLNQAIALGNK